MFSDMLRQDRERWGLSVGQAAWRFGVKPAEYRELEAGTRSPSFEVYDRVCKLFGWPQAFVGRSSSVVGKIMG
jgi:predicted transcriptional regulator